MADNSEKDTSWGKVADWYSDLLESASDTYQSEIVLPNLLRLVAPTQGVMILDVACGQGYFSRAFYEQGAEVMGVDIGNELIEYARANSPQDLSYHVAPSHKMSFVDDQSIDVVTVVLALQNIEKYKETLAECGRVLRKGGRLFLVLNHPTFRIPKKSSWGFDEAAHTQYRRVDEYLSESSVEIDMRPGDANEAEKAVKTVSFHRPLQSYSKALDKAGFAISRIEEWTSHKTSEDGPRANAENRSRNEIPMFMMVQSTKQ